MNDDFSLWDSIVKAFQDFATIMAEGIPRLVMAVVFFVAGYLVSKIISTIIKKTLQRLSFDDLAVKLKIDEPLKTLGLTQGLSALVAKIVFWLIMLVVIVTTSKNLGIDVITEQVDRIIDFIPNLVTAILIILIGYLIADKLREVILNLTKSLSGGAGSVLASVLYYFIMVMVVITAIDQLGVKTDLISKNIVVIIAVILIAGAVAYGYAARDIMKNILSSFYSKKNFHPGQTVKVLDVEGKILEIDKTSVIILANDSKVILPVSVLLNNKVEIVAE